VAAPEVLAHDLLDAVLPGVRRRVILPEQGTAREFARNRGEAAADHSSPRLEPGGRFFSGVA
jgi:hypothetical protein